MSSRSTAFGVIRQEVAAENKNLEWCFRPILIWWKLIGIPLDFNVLSGSKLDFCWKTFVALFFFLLDVSSNLIVVIFSVIYTTNPSHYPRLQFSYTSMWNEIIRHLNYALLTMGTHVGILASTSVKWPALIRAFLALEEELKMSLAEYRKLRSKSIIGLVFMVLSTFSIIGWLVAPILFMDTMPLDHKIILVLHFLGGIYTFNSAILFSTLAWTIADMIRVISNRVIDYCNIAGQQGRNKNLIGKGKLKDVIICWRRQYLLTDRVVGEINNSFGFILLTLTASGFIRMVSSSFQLMSISGIVYWRQVYTLVYFMVAELAYLATIAYVCHRLEKEAVQLTRNLCKLHFNDCALQNLVDFFVLEVHHSSPKITACGFFQIGLHLLPTFVGSTLTYLIILYQFKTSETK